MFQSSAANSPSRAEDSGAKDNDAKDANRDFYHDFDDILIPRAMDLETGDSFVIETPSTKSGILLFKGSMDLKTLTNYFLKNMVKDGWTYRCSFKSKRTILVFEKPQRFCIINITDGYSTTLQLWVAPKAAGSTGDTSTGAFYRDAGSTSTALPPRY